MNTRERISRKIGSFTLALRLICSALVVFPLFDYVKTVFINDGDGNAYLFFILLVLGFFAGIILIVNSLFCLYQYRNIESPLFSFAFILVGVVGIFMAWHFLPQFRM